MITKRKLNNKLDLLLKRQSLMMELLTSIHCSAKQREKITKMWNDLWYKIMEGEE